MSDEQDIPPSPQNAADQEVLAASRKQTRRSFAIGAVAAGVGYSLYRWIDRAPQVGRIQGPLRDALNFNSAVARAVFDERALAPTYRRDQAVPLRLNGTIGLAQGLVPDSWRLQLVGSRNDAQSPHYVQDVTAWEYKYTGAMQTTPQAQDVKSAPGNGTAGTDVSKTGQRISARTSPTPSSDLAPGGAVDSEAGAALAARIAGLVHSQSKKRNVGDDEAGPSASSLDIGTPGLLLSMDDLTRQLPKVELVMQFKCIEGWSNITQWAGFRFRDLLELYPPQPINGRDPRYVYLETPDGNYYGGYDLSMARHPQTLLVTEMHGAPLAQEHGAPIRLYTPLKYGYKQIKRIGLIAYTNLKPDDYWTKLGYDWYAGL
jgi:hypothetical protein